MCSAMRGLAVVALSLLVAGCGARTPLDSLEQGEGISTDASGGAGRAPGDDAGDDSSVDQGNGCPSYWLVCPDGTCVPLHC